jgi:hypothetical protein
MKGEIYPLALPPDLANEIRRTAKETDLSMADVMRQSVKLGLQSLREQFASRTGRVTNVDPLPHSVLDKLYREREDDEESIRRFIDLQPREAE